MGEVISQGFGYSHSRPWIENQNLLASTKEREDGVKVLDMMMYRCEECKMTYSVEKWSYLVIASMFYLHYHSPCKKVNPNETMRIVSEKEILLWARIKFYSLLKTLKMHGVFITIKIEESPSVKAVKTQARLFELAHDSPLTNKVFFEESK